MYLLDTDTLSTFSRRNPDPNVSAWMAGQRITDMYISVITIGEIERGIALQARRNPDYARTLVEWLDGVLLTYRGRILPVDMRIARRWGQLSALIGNNNPDLIIAATALERDLIMVTRNVRHFAPTGVQIIDPFRQLDAQPI